MFSAVILVLALAASSLAYQIPAPQITTLCPQGIQLTIPDAPDIRTVKFFISFDKQVANRNPGRVFQQESLYQWVYSNPDLDLQVGDLVRYEIEVDANGTICTREGTEVVARGNCEDDGQHHVPLFPSSGSLSEDSLSQTGNLKNSLKSSYSMYKSMDSKPITRSLTTTSTGTFYVKPTGQVETSGYKSSSSFDSTRRAGDQWQHSKQELSQAEIEELKRIHGADFFTMPAFAHLQGLHGAHGSSGLSGLSGSSSSYHYSSSSTSSSQARPTYGSTSILETGQTAEDHLPIMRPSGYSYSQYDRSQTANQPISSSYTSSDTSYIRKPSETSYIRTPSVSETSYFRQPSKPVFSSSQDDYQTLQPVASPTYVETKYHKSEVVKTSSPTIIQPIPAFPVSGSSTKTSETYELTSPPKSVAPPQPLSNTFTTFSGEIFQSNVRPTSPESCKTADYGLKHSSQINLVDLEHSVEKMQCLAVLAENSLKAEVRSLKEANANLFQRLQDLEQQFRRFRSDCKCSGF